MSDLHRAVQAEIAAHTPSLPPSFDALRARERTRERRRTAAAVAATALAVAAVVVAPAALGLGEDGRSAPTVAGDGPDTSQNPYAVRCAPGDYTDRSGDYAGLTEQQAQDMAAAEGNTARVIRRDGMCQSVDQNLDPSRVSLVVEDGAVVWAGQDRLVVQGYTPPGVEVRVEEPALAGKPVRMEAIIQHDRDVAVHRVEFGDGTEQVVQFTCADSSPRPAPPGPQTHVVEHTWDKPGEYTLTFHYGPPCQEATSSVARAVRVDQ